MKYAIIQDGVVVQVQPYEDDNTVEAPDEVLPGYAYDGDEFTPPAGPPLDEIKTVSKRDVDASAERARMSFVTSGAGQQAVYLEKASQALAADVEDTPDEDDYPLLKASIGIEADTLAGVITIVKATRSAWIQAASLIEGARLGGKKAIAEAEDAETVATARATAIASLDAIRPPA